MITKEKFDFLLLIWMGLAVVIFPVLLRVTVPYGKHTHEKWGPLIPSKWGWLLMEIPVLVVISWYFFTGKVEKSSVVYVFYGLFMLHYLHRTFIFPFMMRDKGKKMPVVIVLMGIFFNFCNGFFNGYWLGNFSSGFDASWFFDVRFITGILLFFAGMLINIYSDQQLIKLRKGGKQGYYIPRGGLFNYVSSPNLFGEIIEWAGWAILVWSLPAFSFALWTIVNLVPRALDHHRWYKKYFKDYPEDRKAVFPFLL